MPNGFDEQDELETPDQQATAADQFKDLAREEVKKRAKQAIQKAVIEPAQRAIAHGAKAAASAIWTSVILPTITFLAGTIKIWGPVVGIILLVIIVMAVLLSGSQDICVEGVADNPEVKAMYKDAGMKFPCFTPAEPVPLTIEPISIEESGAAPGAAEAIMRGQYGEFDPRPFD